MNKKPYWILRKKIQNIVFKIKKVIYILIDSWFSVVEYKSFRQLIIMYSTLEIMKGMVIAAVVLVLDNFVLKRLVFSEVDKNVFVPCIIGGIGIAGVILGLYCSNVATIYSTRYANAPISVTKAFQNDKLTRKCISDIVDYIVFGFVVLSVAMIGMKFSWIVVIVSILWSVIVIVSYSIAGNRAYQLSDIYSIADDTNRILYLIVSERLHQAIFASDMNFQNHFMEVAEKRIEILRSIQKYGESEIRSDHTTLTEFMCKNLALISAYWNDKADIDKLSLWYRDKQKYQKWHLTDGTESSLALRTGTALRTKGEHDYWWFEDELLSINKDCINILVLTRDYKALYTYLLALDQVCGIAIKSKEANYYIAYVNFLRRTIEKCMNGVVDGDETGKSFAGLVDVVSLLYLNIILEICKFYQNFDFNATFEAVLKSIDKDNDYKNNPTLRRRGNKDYYDRIVTEIIVEGKRITPDWVIKQQVAKEEYVYLNTLLDIVREGINHAFELGRIFFDKKLYFEACIIFSRFFEYESKLSNLVMIVKDRKTELETYHVDKELVWDAFRLDRLNDTLMEWKRELPSLLSECSCNFALDNWNKDEDFPDFLGESFNHICEDAVDSIIGNDIEQFSADYGNLSKLMLLYQEYIRSDFVKKNKLYRAEYAYYMFTYPIVEWAQIGGLAILWGEFHSAQEWKEIVCKGSKDICVKDEKVTDLPEKLVEYTQHRDSFMLGIGNRGILETEWKLKVENAIRKSDICELEYGKYGVVLKTDSKLLKAFCRDFPNWGFTIDPAEVFWVMCVNPYLSKAKEFKTRDSWDEEMSDV